VCKYALAIQKARNGSARVRNKLAENAPLSSRSVTCVCVPGGDGMITGCVPHFACANKVGLMLKILQMIKALENIFLRLDINFPSDFLDCLGQMRYSEKRWAPENPIKGF
jgi:hypothetical protein